MVLTNQSEAVYIKLQKHRVFHTLAKAVTIKGSKVTDELTEMLTCLNNLDKIQDGLEKSTLVNLYKEGAYYVVNQYITNRTKKK